MKKRSFREAAGDRPLDGMAFAGHQVMDMLTCAASSVSASAEQDSGSSDRPSTGAQILALKRKIIECDQELKGTRDRADALERALEMEKREHQLTTSKLTQLLKKRGVSVPDGGGSEEEIQRLRQTVRAQHSLQALMLRTREDSRHQLLRR